jgi:CRISPR-associated protein Csd1
MLKALYDYALRHELTLPAGYVNKTIKAYVKLSTRSDYVGLFLNDDTAVPCPDIGSMANSTDKCNILVEKRIVVFPVQPSVKSNFFLQALQSAAQQLPDLELCVRLLKSPEQLEKVRTEMDRNKIKDTERISFMIDDVPIVSLPGIADWWQQFRQQFRSADPEETTVCLITGEQTVPVATTAKIQGLRVVGGHSSGDALICFDKAAFQSYELKKAANAPVSEEAFSAVKAALDRLLEDAPVLAGEKFVHWFDRNIQPKDDPIWQSLDFGYEDDEDDEEPVMTKAEQDLEEQDARRKADSVIQSVETGVEPLYDLTRTRYYILLLTGVGGRIMIRRYLCGSYQQLRDNLQLWHQDLTLTNASGKAALTGCKLKARLLRLLKYQKTDSHPFERADKELSGITPAVLTSILTGCRLPTSVAVRALAYIRSKMLGADNDDLSIPIPDSLACQWLKVWLIRENRAEGKEDFLMEEYNMQHPEAAYHCGGIMAVYAAIQNAAMPDVNAGIIQRYYASASQTPAMVLGQLSRLSQYHLGKMENGWLAEQYKGKLEQLYTAIDGAIPVTLDPKGQSYFALGYYQMSAKLNREKTDRIAAKKQKDQAVAENEEE